MIVDIDKIIVKDRIRKDFGDIQELADDIKQNGLINPPVVNKEYELLAGERRLRACKSLGWPQIEIRMMDTRDAEHELNVEISENDVRKGFTKSERVDYMKRLLRIEQAKAKERQESGKKDLSENSHEGRSDEATASQFGISSNTMRKEMSIVENKDLLSAEDFADWDEGKLSTNKAFQKIKAEQERLRKDNEELQAFADDKEAEAEELRKEVAELKSREPEVKTVTKEVIPKDYETFKIQAVSAEKARKETADKLSEALRRIKDLEERKDISEMQKKLEAEAGLFAIRVYDFIQKNGGFVWIFEKLEELPEKQRKEFISAIRALDGFTQTMITNLGGYAIER